MMATLRRLSNSQLWVTRFTFPIDAGSTGDRARSTNGRPTALPRSGNDAAREAQQGRFIQARKRKAIAEIFALADKGTFRGAGGAWAFNSVGKVPTQ
jgi:hypothetical protein